MSRDFFDPIPEDQVIVLVEDEDLRAAEKLIESCEHCDRDSAEIPFDNILDLVTGSDPSVTDYIFEVKNIISVMQLFACWYLSLASRPFGCA
jgi:hypothetical protein